MREHKTRAFWLFLLAAAFVVSAFTAGADAQTRHRRTTTPAVPAASPTPLPGEAQIIQTADQPDPTTFVAPGRVNPSVDQPDTNVQKVKELTARVKKLEASSTDPYEAKQKRMLLNLDILTRAEQRSEALRKQLFDMIEKENTIKTRLDQIEYDIRPEMISRAATFAGSMRPEEVREIRKKALDSEKANLETLLNKIQLTKGNLTTNLQRSDALVEKLRSKLEKDIDDSFKDDEPDR